MKVLTVERARELVRAMRGVRVLVVGDVMLDEFVWGKVSRISPEAPVPVVQVTGQSFHVGGAGNVARNIRSLGGRALLAGVVGSDAAAERIKEDLAAAGVTASLVRDPGRPTTLKTRIIAHHQQIVRADRERAEPLSGELEAELLRRVERSSGSWDAVVVSDYQKGVVTPRLMRQVASLGRRRGIPTLVDPKVAHFELYRGVSVITPNQLEAEQATGRRIRTAPDLAAVGRRLLSRLACRGVLLTRGEHGMSLFEPGQRPFHVPTAAREVFDVTGAGDTVIASLALALCAGAAMKEAAVLANHAAGVAVGKLGTAVVEPGELVAAVDGA
jgi:rfaE bifunctional protein kinase chain/domain